MSLTKIKLSKQRAWRFYVPLFALIFMGAGYLIINSFAANTCDPNTTEICVKLPDNNYTLTEDFLVQTVVTTKIQRAGYNIKVVLDKGQAGEQVIDARRHTATQNAGAASAVTFNFHYGNPNSGANGANTFDRQLLVPGNHTITAEIRTGDMPATGVLFGTHTVNFKVSNVKNLMTSREAPKTFFVPQFPLKGSNTPRLAGVTTGEATGAATIINGTSGLANGAGSTIEAAKNTASKAGESLGNAVFPKVAAHTCDTGCRHGDLDVIAQLPDGTKIAGVTVTAVPYATNIGNCHNGSVQTTHLPGGDANFRDCGVSANSCSGDPSCSATYRVTVSGTPAGYSLNDVSTKDVSVVWMQNRDIHFYYKLSAAATPPALTCPNAPPTSMQTNIRSPLYRYYSAARTDHMYQMTPLSSADIAAGYCYEGYVGYVYPNQVPGSVPLHRYYNNRSGNDASHYYVLNRNDSGLTTCCAYSYEGVAGYVSSTFVDGWTTPLYRYYSPGQVDQFYTSTWTELGAGKYDYVYQNTEGNTWLNPGAYYGYEDNKPPQLSLTGLTGTSATVNMFAMALDSNGYPFANLNKVMASVDGVVTHNQSVYNPNDYKTRIGYNVNLGNIADGKYHTVVIAASVNNGQTASMTFYINPYPPPTGAVSNASATSADPYTETINYTGNVGSLKIRTYVNSQEGNVSTFFKTPLPKQIVYADNIGSKYECDSGLSSDSYETSITYGTVTLRRCPVASNPDYAARGYPKTYNVYAVIPPTYHLDDKFRIMNNVKITTHPFTKERVAVRKVRVTVNATRIVSFIFVKDTPYTAPASPNYIPTHEADFLTLVNDARAKLGLAKVTLKADIAEVARGHSYDMIQYNYFGHPGWSGADTCTNLTERMKTTPYTGKMGEIISYDPGSVDAWYTMYGAPWPDKYNPNDSPSLYDHNHGYWNSPDHRKIIIMPEARYIGVGSLFSTSFAENKVKWVDEDKNTLCTKLTDNPPKQHPLGYIINTTVFAEKIDPTVY